MTKEKNISSKVLSKDARNALSEAEERRKSAAKTQEIAAERGGPRGEEPTRFGDWERKGIAYDF